MTTAIISFILGLFLLIKAGDWFVDGASSIAKRFKIPEIIVGATIVSIGTTLPEVMVSATSAVQGEGSISFGNAIGSIICNTSLIAAITIAAKPGLVDRKSFRIPVIFFFVAAIFYSIIAYTTGKFDRWMGIALLVFFIVYMITTIVRGKKHPEEASDEEDDEEDDSNKDTIWIEISLLGLGVLSAYLIPSIAKPIIIVLSVILLFAFTFLKNKIFKSKENSSFYDSFVYDIILLIVGAAFIAFGADLLVTNTTIIATEIGIDEKVIALTLVALGTSLPELVTAITSLSKGHGSLSLGNVIGANLFNIVLVCGTAITLQPFEVPNATMLNVFGNQVNASLLIDIPVMLLVMAFMTIPPLVTGKLKRYQGIILLAIYISFIVLQFILYI